MRKMPIGMKRMLEQLNFLRLHESLKRKINGFSMMLRCYWTHYSQVSPLRGKVVSRNFRGLLKRGDICVRVEYAKAEREKLTELEQGRVAFEEGSLETCINGRKAEKLFGFISSTYFQSKVMEDVYYQTKDETDRKGGYSITMLEEV